MTWVRLDDGFAEHPKMEAAGPLGLALHVAALCYCARHLTDGYIPATKVPRLLDLPTWRKVAQTLVDAGVWDEADGGWQLHDYLDYQPSRADYLKAQATKVDAAVRGNHQRWHVDRGQPSSGCPLCIADGIAPAIADGIAPANRSGIPPSRPVPSPTSSSLQGHSRSQALAAAAAEEVSIRRGLPSASKAKERPQRWLAAAVLGITRDVQAHPEFGRLVHENATPAQVADLLEPTVTPTIVAPYERPIRDSA